MAPAAQPPDVHVPRPAVVNASVPTVVAGVEAAPVLDAEKLVAYRLALELQVLVGTLIPPQHRVLADQLERASLSVVLNIAGGGPEVAQGQAPLHRHPAWLGHGDRGGDRRAEAATPGTRR
jgi:hypothetical protein